MRRLFIISLLFSFISCQEESNPNFVAQFDDYILTRSDIMDVIPKNLDEDDSLQFVNDYIERWVKDKVLMHEKDSFLTEEEITKIESQVARYRQDLTEITIEEKLTTGFSDEVSDKELKDYYEKFPDTFILDKDIIAYRFMQIPKDSVLTYKQLLRNGGLEELQAKLNDYGYYHDLTPENWIEKNDLLKADVLPEKLKNYPLMSGSQIYTITENGKSFVLEVVEVGREGQQAPFTYIKPTIKSVVLNKRKLNLLSQKKNELYEKALENDEIKRN